LNIYLLYCWLSSVVISLLLSFVSGYTEVVGAICFDFAAFEILVVLAPFRHLVAILSVLFTSCFRWVERYKFLISISTNYVSSDGLYCLFYNSFFLFILFVFGGWRDTILL
jgi:hypothetical protein